MSDTIEQPESMLPQSLTGKHTLVPGSGPALAFLISGAFWFAIGTIFGLFSAMHLVSPEFFNNMAYFVFGRTRPEHVNTVIYGFVSAMLLGGALYYVPALLKTRLWSTKMGWFSFVMWNITVLSGPILFPMGISQGREYAEYIWPFDVSLVLAILGVVVNLVMTIVGRQEKILYVSVWYVTGSMLWMTGVYPIGNVMWHPYTGAEAGLIDSVLLWFYGHNLVGLLLTPLALGAAYFVVPRVTKTPLYSHTLSLLGFWLLVAIYTHIGGHHILQTPIPNWLKTVSVVDSIGMIVPVFTVLANLWLTARGKFSLLWHDVGGRWVMVGTLWYLVTCIQGPLQSLPSVQKVTHMTQWTVGHAHIAVLGFSGFIALGLLWHVLPLITRRELWSKRLVSLQFGLVLFGLAGFFVTLTTAGLIQGGSWRQGVAVYNTLPMMAPYMVLRLVSGLFIITGAWLGLINVVMTIRRGKPFDPNREEEVRQIPIERPQS
jgi:cbb3-type cytochrome c oxidase subunit I